MLKISPTALRAFLACPRSWYLSHVQRVPKEVPAYVTGGRELDDAVQKYLTSGAETGSEQTRAELEVSKAELPAPLTVVVQPKLSFPCPGLEDCVRIEGTLDALTPPNLDLMVVIDMKRIWHAQAAMSAADLANDVQALMYSWLVWRNYAPAEVINRWVYCVRETRNKETGKVTRKAKSFSVDVKADRAAVEAWFARVVLPAARAMLEIRDAARAAEAVEHDPTSCEEGARCFVRHHCPMYSGPVRGENNMVDLSRFRTGARPAINPPAPAELRVPGDGLAEAVLTGAVEPQALSVTTIEGPGAALLEAVPDNGWHTPDAIYDAMTPLSAERATEPAPAPELLSAEALTTLISPEAKPARRRRGRAEKQAIEAHEAEVVAPPSVESATTEALVWELRDRGYVVTLEAGAL